MAQMKQPSPVLEVTRAVDRAWILIGRKRPEDAWAVLQEADAIARANGISSAFLHWALAVAADLCDEARDAVEHIMKALRLEPCSSPIQGSYGIIVRKTQASLEDLAPTDAGVSFLFGLLVQLEAVDASAADRYSRCALAHEDVSTALAWAERALQMEPPTAARLRHLADLLDRADRHQDARARRHEAEALGLTFPCPQARG